MVLMVRDGFPNVLLRWLASVIYEPLSFIFQLSFRLYILPACWLHAVAGKGYFAECGLRNAENCQRVICGKFDADFFSAE